MSLRIALVDDHAMIREGLRHLLCSVAQFEVVAESASGREALLIVAMNHKIKVVILSVHSTLEHIYQAFAAGACGYVLKESIGKELIAAIRAAHCGKRYLSRKIDEKELLRKMLSGGKSPLEGLSKRERQVLQLVVEGASSASIAEQLALSPKTIETYRSRLMQKLGVPDIPALVKFAIQHGLTTIE
ncbi:MAG: response regulator transcription factor [Deltaproteobacteria bacterium]|nr:response regulator transcription factor [Deltaproteobacteria bacterium]